MDDKTIRAIASQGERRCLNDRRRGTIVSWPEPKPRGWKEAVKRRQINAMHPVERDQLQMELLLRSTMLIELMDSNLGMSADFPLQVRGENQTAIDVLNYHIGRVRHALGALTEI